MRVDEHLRSVLQARACVQLAYLFGSAARGTATVSSDIDVALLTTDECDLNELTAALERALGARIDLVDLRSAPPLLAREIMREGVVLVSRDEGRRAAFELRALSTFLDTQHLRDVQHAYLRERVEARHGATR
jgi:predicted nucleotidyltransferase